MCASQAFVLKRFREYLWMTIRTMRSLSLPVVPLCTFVFLGGIAQCADVDKLVSELSSCRQASISDTLVPGSGIEFTTETRSHESNEVTATEAVVAHFLSDQQWRVDSDATFFGGDFHYCRNDDFWFVAMADAGAYRYDRLGFTTDVASSIEVSLRSRLEPVFSSTYVLDFPLGKFATLPGNTFSASLDMQNKQSECALAWDLTPAKETGLLAAYGSLEWWRSPRGPRVTYLRYAFGTRPSAARTASPGIERIIEYDTASKTAYPIKLVYRQGNSTSTTTLKVSFPANNDVAHYSPTAFGLDRPRRPIPTWVYLLVAGIAFGVASFALRRFRNRYAANSGSTEPRAIASSVGPR